MKEENHFIRDVIVVMLSNGIVLVSSIVTGLIVPKMLGVESYGYYKIFTLYTGYTALLHFGFIDGILLIHSGQEYEKIDKDKFKFNTHFFLLFQIIVSILFVFIAVFFLNGITRFIVVLLGLNTFFSNVACYYQYVSQAMMRFKEFSIRKILQAFITITMTGLLYFLVKTDILKVVNSYIYIGMIVFINFLLMIWYMFTYKDITYGRCVEKKESIKEITIYFKKGFALTIAYQVAQLIFSLDRQFVSLLYDTETYAVYSFAYSLMSMVTTIIGAISIVLFPSLKKKTEEQIVGSYGESMALISILSFFALLGYYPLSSFINWFLPEYVESLKYLRVLIPGLSISCCITIIIFTYYKVLDKNKLYFKIGCVILIVSAAFNGIAQGCFQSPLAISVASLITLILWYIVLEFYFIRKYSVKWIKNLLYIVIMMIMFYIVTLANNPIIGMILYITGFVSITCAFYIDFIKQVLYKIKSKRNTALIDNKVNKKIIRKGEY